MNPLETVIAYHELTKHHFHRYAPSAGYMDWANQPDPFRRFAGAPCIQFDLTDDDGPNYHDLFASNATSTQPLTRESIGRFFEFALALSAWKEFKGTRWALRCNPSSGNLHPTEGYLVAPAIHEIGNAGVFHYAPKLHALERRADVPTADMTALLDGYPPGTFLVGLTSVHWREAWKYGERAYRYCQHDAGHAFAALVASAATLGWQCRMLNSPSDAQIAALLGLDRNNDFADAEREHPDLFAAVTTDRSQPVEQHPLSSSAIARIADADWLGQANRLSREHVNWPNIERVAEACEKPVTPPAGAATLPDLQLAPPPAQAIPARRIIRQRRSAVDMDGHTFISRDAFYRMLSQVMPCRSNALWNAFGMPTCVHLGLFVHRVRDLTPGVYFLVRDASQLARIRQAAKPDFLWEMPPDCPAGLPLSLLLPADCRKAAGIVSCGQDIAADGAFSLGMIVDFEQPLEAFGPWFYRRLFWETGAIGQVLYLEAEAHGVRSTGIGCFFDDPVHELLGLSGHRFQSLYHFTVGKAVEDTRLTTLPAYDTHPRES